MTVPLILLWILKMKSQPVIKTMEHRQPHLANKGGSALRPGLSSGGSVLRSHLSGCTVVTESLPGLSPPQDEPSVTGLPLGSDVELMGQPSSPSPQVPWGSGCILAPWTLTTLRVLSSRMPQRPRNFHLGDSLLQPIICKATQ